MIKKNGKIIIFSSIFGSISKSMRSSYSSSKFGIKGLTKSSALDLASKNILIAYKPEFIETKLTKKNFKKKWCQENQKIQLKIRKSF